jgi:hypothetical protein
MTMLESDFISKNSSGIFTWTNSNGQSFSADQLAAREDHGFNGIIAILRRLDVATKSQSFGSAT